MKIIPITAVAYKSTVVVVVVGVVVVVVVDKVAARNKRDVIYRQRAVWLQCVTV